MNRKLTINLIVLGLVLSGVIWLVLWLTTAKVVIQTTTGADIYAKQGSAEFKKIGSTEATYSTRSTETVFIEARIGGRAAQGSIEPVRRQTVSIQLAVGELVAIERVADGPLLYPFITERFIYGINPATRGLKATPRTGHNAQPPILPQLPFLNKVVWFDNKNFLYLAQGRGAGIINSKLDGDNHSPTYYIDGAAIGSTKSLALLTYDALYLTKGLNLDTAQKIYTMPLGATGKLFTQGDQIYLASLIYQQPEGSDEGRAATPKETLVTIFSNQGKQQRQFSLPITSDVIRINQVDQDSLAILTTSGLSLLNMQTKNISNQTFDFGLAQDMIEYRDRLLLMGESGLWQYLPNSKQYNRLVDYPAGERYVPQSLSLVNGNLYFSTALKDEQYRSNQITGSSSIYKVVLN